MEARTRAELIARGVDLGRLALRCDGDLLRVSFAPPVGVPRELSEADSGVSSERADQLVALVGKLLESEPAAADSLPPAPTAAQPESPPPSQAKTPEPAPVPASNHANSVASPAPQTDEAVRAPVGDESRARSTLVIGGTLEPWSTEISGTAGALVGVTVPLTGRFALRGSASHAWGLEGSHGVTVRQLLVEGAVESTLTHWSIVSLGGGLSSMTFQAEGKEADGATTSLAPVLTFALRLVPRDVSPRFTLGPLARFFGKTREATIDDKPALHVPRWSVALEAEGRFDL